MNTGMGNVLQMCLAMKCYIDHIGLNCEFIDDGDDCGLIMEEEHLPKLVGSKEYFLELGFRMVFEEPVREIEKVVFCGSQPVFVDGEYLMVRDFRAALAKDSCMLRNFDSEKYFNIVKHAVGCGGIALNGGIPILQSFYQSLVRDDVSDGQLQRALRDPSLKMNQSMKLQGMTRHWQEVSEETRYSFWLAFGMTPEEQLALEDYYLNLDVPYSFGDCYEKAPYF
jgi:hypothetical protein